MEMEETAATKLRKKGWVVFSPTVVCDRIAIKGRKIYFIEFKKPGQQLTVSQEKVRSLADNYRIMYY